MTGKLLAVAQELMSARERAGLAEMRVQPSTVPQPVGSPARLAHARLQCCSPLLCCSRPGQLTILVGARLLRAACVLGLQGCRGSPSAGALTPPIRRM